MNLFEKLYQTLVLRVLSEDLITSKQYKHLACGLVLSSVSRYLDPPMKHSHSYLIYYMDDLMTAYRQLNDNLPTA